MSTFPAIIISPCCHGEVLAERAEGVTTASAPRLDAHLSQCSGPHMGRWLPKLIVMLAIGVVVAAIFVVTRRGPSTEPNVVYVNPGFSTPAPATPAP